MKKISILVCFCLVVIASTVNAQGSLVERYIEGKDYMVLAEPVSTLDPSKIEVSEAFAYPCHFCFNLESLLENWVKSQHPDVAFVRTHVTFRPEWVPYQRGYYTALSLSLKGNIDMDIFNEIHVKHHELNTAEEWANFLSSYGVKKETALKTYDSFGVTSRMNQADVRNKAFKITATPTIIVEGKYKVINSSGGNEETLKIAEFLVEKVRAEKRIH